MNEDKQERDTCTCETTEGWASYPIYSLSGGITEGVHCDVCDKEVHRG